MIYPSTFSIVAADVETGEVGVAVQSKFLGVGAAVPWVDASAGAVATQAWANTTYGPRGLAFLREGRHPQEAVDALVGDDPQREQRQLGIVDARGRAASFTGSGCMDWAGGIVGDGFAAQGNILAGAAVVDGMAQAFVATRGYLADRLIAALRAGQAAGGDRRGQQSAALVIAKPAGGYGGFNDRYVDLRVDDHVTPIEELARILELHKLYFFAARPEDVRTVDGMLGSEISRRLQATGDLERAHSGSYDDAARAALVRFMHRENLEDRVREDGNVDVQTLEYLRTASGAAG